MLSFFLASKIRDAAKLWGITDDELKAIQEALAENRKPKSKGLADEESEGDNE